MFIIDGDMIDSIIQYLQFAVFVFVISVVVGSFIAAVVTITSMLFGTPVGLAVFFAFVIAVCATLCKIAIDRI